MFDIDIASLDVDAVLSHVAQVRALSERAEVRVLEVAAHYADLHAVVDHPIRAWLPGTERLVALGGDGTPEVAEFAATELGAVLKMSPAAGARLIGDALDLRHRLPRLWARVLAGEVKAWIGRNTAHATRGLSLDVVAVVDAKISPWAHSRSWGQLEALIDSAVIAADPDTAQDAAEQAEQAQGVWVGQSSDHGIKDIHIRTDAANAIWFDATIDRIADTLKLFGDSDSKDVRRGRAVGVIAQPQHTLDLFHRAAAAAGAGDETETAATTVGVDQRPPVTLYVHISDDVVRGDGAGVARVEGVGPVTSDQVRGWLGHGCVTVKPIIDLNRQAPVDGYEVPDRLREAVHLRSPVDVFPYATNTNRHRDIDHTEPYRDPDHGGPPGQTSLDNLGPLTRFHHRVKTFGRWQVRQPFNGIFVWRSPHGRYYLVDHTGTQDIGNPAA